MEIRSVSLVKVTVTLCFTITLVAAVFAQVENTSDPTSQEKNEDQMLLQKLAVTLFPPSPGLLVLFPATIISAQTPIAIRYTLFPVLSRYQIFAACHPTALSFLGIKDPVDRTKLCDPLSQLIIIYQLMYRLILPELPQEAAGIAQFLKSNGINALDNISDTRTPIGWANVNSVQLRQYFDNDGWNSLGDETKTFYRFPFQDTSGYEPQNNPLTSPMDLSRPLRWQPLSFNDKRGEFGHQIHVVPYIGSSVKPLVLSMEDFESRKAPPPYKFPDMSMGIDPADEKIIRKRIDDLFIQTRTLTDDRVALAYWWESKFSSVGVFNIYYEIALKLQGSPFVVVGGIAEILAQHDAVLVAWKEKVRHDLVRPTTIIRRFLSGKMVNAYRGVGLGNGMLPADEWEPVLQIQPHSEYPSASAIVCEASLERLQVALEQVVGPGGTIPPFELTRSAATIPNSPIAKNITIRFESLREAIKSCGESRLYGGVHFEPAVTEGFKLGKGIGKATFDHMNELVEGRIPKNCARCIKG